MGWLKRFMVVPPTVHKSSQQIKTMTNQVGEQQEQQQKDRGWYCKEHDAKYLCEICGYDSLYNRQKEIKYYFVGG